MPAAIRKYDPSKRHEYYLRTRQLKGRKKPSFVAKDRAELALHEQVKKKQKQVVDELGKKLEELRKQGKEDTPAYKKALNIHKHLVMQLEKNVTVVPKTIIKAETNAGSTIAGNVQGAVKSTAKGYVNLGKSAVKLGVDLTAPGQIYKRVRK